MWMKHFLWETFFSSLSRYRRMWVKLERTEPTFWGAANDGCVIKHCDRVVLLNKRAIMWLRRAGQDAGISWGEDPGQPDDDDLEEANCWR